MTSALVLGGGGVTGIAWTTGLLLGLAEAGVDVTGADVVVGTSAGAAVGAQVATGRALGELYAAQCDEVHHELTAELDLEVLGPIFAELGAGRPLDRDVRARIGAMALAAGTVPEAARRAVVAARLGTDGWPARRLVVTAVDTETGALVVFDSAGAVHGAGLVDAVAASCAVPGVWPPVTVAGRRLMDGGVRSIVNADLAAGADRALVVVPLATLGRVGLDAELEALRAGGTAVLEVGSDEEARAAMGLNPLDPSMRRPAAEAGRRQGAELAGVVGALWGAGG